MSGDVVFGVNPVLELLRAEGRRALKVYLGPVSARVSDEVTRLARAAGVRVESADRERLQRLAGGGVHQGVVAEVRAFAYVELDEVLATAQRSGRPPLLVLLDGVTDPHNLGAIIRSAHAFGAHGVVVPKDRAVGVTPVVEKASAGATAWCPVCRVTNLSRALEALKEEGLWSVAADPGGDQTLWQARLDGPLAVVVGAEGPGVRPGVLGHCDFRVRIPMAGQVASLNASVSAGVLLAEVARQRAAPR